MHTFYNGSSVQCYFTAIRNKKCCFKVENHEHRNSNYFPYFLNMQKIFCFKWDGHARDWNVIFMGSTVADICSNCKCNRLWLKMGKEGRRKKKTRKKQVFPLSPPKYKHTLNNCCDHCFFLPLFLITKQLTSIHNTHHLRALSYTPPISKLEKGHGCLLESTTSNESEDELLKCLFTASQFVATGNQETHTDKMSTWFQWKKKKLVTNSQTQTCTWMNT